MRHRTPTPTPTAGLEVLERVGGVPHVDESGDAPIAAPALQPVHVFDRGHCQRATADNRSTLADAEAFVVVAAHGGRAASAKQKTSRHDVGGVGFDRAQLAPHNQHVALADREILREAPVAAHECLVQLSAAGANGAFEFDHVAAARIDDVVDIAPDPRIRRRQRIELDHRVERRLAFLVLEVNAELGFDVRAPRVPRKRARAAPTLQRLTRKSSISESSTSAPILSRAPLGFGGSSRST